jgi:hypothetical protein
MYIFKLLIIFFQNMINSNIVKEVINIDKFFLLIDLNFLFLVRANRLERFSLLHFHFAR